MSKQRVSRKPYKCKAPYRLWIVKRWWEKGNQWVRSDPLPYTEANLLLRRIREGKLEAKFYATEDTDLPTVEIGGDFEMKGEKR